jgi:hypothetical protein
MLGHNYIYLVIWGPIIFSGVLTTVLFAVRNLIKPVPPCLIGLGLLPAMLLIAMNISFVEVPGNYIRASVVSKLIFIVPQYTISFVVAAILLLTNVRRNLRLNCMIMASIQVAGLLWTYVILQALSD